jgi:hypothetical protein
MHNEMTIAKFIILTVVLLTWVFFVVKKRHPLTFARVIFYSAFLGIGASLTIFLIQASLYL